jgi:hypothetical protein
LIADFTILNSTFCGAQVCNQLKVIASASELAEQWLDTIKNVASRTDFMSGTQLVFNTVTP